MAKEKDEVVKDLSVVSSNLIGNCPSGPSTLHLVMEKEGFKELLKDLKEYANIITKPFSLSFMIDLYDIPEGSDFRPGFSCLRIYPRGKKNISEWTVAQHIESKYDSSDIVESPLIEISDLKKHYKI